MVRIGNIIYKKNNITIGVIMRTIQMTLDDELVETVDALTKELKTTRSAFTREALKGALRHYQMKKLESSHRRGYERFPAVKQEFDLWEKEQVWGEE
jgi:CopG family transcriptional regulator / antitoxin EndoAI